MEATYKETMKGDVLSTISEKGKAAFTSCWMLIDSKSKEKISNTDIIIWINEQHKSLDDNHEVGIKINHLGKEIVFYIDHIAHQNQAMIYFKGHTEKGKIVHFVKHSSELDIQLEVLKRRDSVDMPKLPFGFNDWDAYDQLKEVNT